MVNKTNKRKQMWADASFIEKLEKTKAKSILEGKPIKSIPDLTRELLNTPSFNKAIEEALKGEVRICIRFDKKRL